MRWTLVLVLLSLSSGVRSQSFLDWIFGDNDGQRHQGQSPPNVPKGFPASGEMIAKIPFELKTADEKFLDEAQKYGNLELSELDVCHHRLIMQIRTTCGSMSEEDISKLSVNLLNCQSYVEGRPIFPCSKHMSLQECTQPMDQNTWNAYHIISSRARSICYSARQQQFRASAEITVNKLALTAREQLDALKNLQEGQEKLGGVTVSMLNSMSEGQRELMDQQMSIKSSQANINSHMSENMRMLVREKALIASGQKELSALTEEILKKLVDAQEQLSNQEELRKQNHEELIKDLSHMVEVAQSFQKQVDESTRTLTQLQSEAASYFEATVDNLNRINSSISYLMTLLTQIKGEVDQKLGWIMNLAGGTEQRMNVVYTCSVHLAYFLVAAVCVLFLQAPAVARVALFICVLSNALWELQYAESLGFIQLTATIAFIVACHWFIVILYEKKGHLMPPVLKSIANGSAVRDKPTETKTADSVTNRGLFQRRENTSSYSSTTRRNVLADVSNTIAADSSVRRRGAEDSSDDDDESADDVADLPDTTSSFSQQLDGLRGALHRGLVGRNSGSSTPLRVSGSRSSTPQRSSRPPTPRSGAPKPICKGKTKNGGFCRLACSGDTEFCRLHQ